MTATLYFNNGEHFRIRENSVVNGKSYNDLTKDAPFSEFLSYLLIGDSENTVTNTSKDGAKTTYKFYSSAVSHIVCKD